MTGNTVAQASYRAEHKRKLSGDKGDAGAYTAESIKQVKREPELLGADRNYNGKDASGSKSFGDGNGSHQNFGLSSTGKDADRRRPQSITKDSVPTLNAQSNNIASTEKSNISNGSKQGNLSNRAKDSSDIKKKETEEDAVSKPKPPMINGMIDKQSLLNMKPKRPLSAYNFFFQEERSKLLGVPPCTEEEKKKRKHRKSHGKIAFTELAKHVGQKWKNLDKETKALYEKKQSEDKKRYQKELSLYDQMIKEIHGMVGNDDDDDPPGPALTPYKSSAAAGSKMARTKAAGAAAALQNDPNNAIGGGATKSKANSGATPNQMAQLLNFQKQQQQQQMHMAQGQFMPPEAMGAMPGMGMGMGMGMGGMVMGGGMPGMGPGGMGGYMPPGGMNNSNMNMGGMNPGMVGLNRMPTMGNMQGMNQGMTSAGSDPATQAALGRERYERALLAAVYDKMMRGEGGQMPPGMNPAQMPPGMNPAMTGGGVQGHMMNPGSSFGGQSGKAGPGKGKDTGMGKNNQGQNGNAKSEKKSQNKDDGEGNGVSNDGAKSEMGMGMGIGMAGFGMPDNMDQMKQQEFQQQLFMMQQMQQDQQMASFGMENSQKQNNDQNGFPGGAYGQFAHSNWQGGGF